MNKSESRRKDLVQSINKRQQKNNVCWMGAPLNIYFILFLVLLDTAAPEIFIICDNTKCPNITVYQILSCDRRTDWQIDGRMDSGVLVIRFRFILWVWYPDNWSLSDLFIAIFYFYKYNIDQSIYKIKKQIGCGGVS